MIIQAITTMPDIFDATQYGILGHAIKSGTISLNTINLRDFSKRDDGRIDDRPYGGGPGMVIAAEPMYQAIQSVMPSYVIELCPKGKPLNQTILKRLAKKDNLTLVLGRYEGIDDRISPMIHEKISIGDYVLSGGEIPALVLIDALARYVPGVITQASVDQDSFENQLLDHPHYTRPEEWQGNKVPKELMSGNHQSIEDWRLMQSLGQTWLNRPDLLINRNFSQRELALLAKFVQNHQRRGIDYEY